MLEESIVHISHFIYTPCPRWAKLNVRIILLLGQKHVWRKPFLPFHPSFHCFSSWGRVNCKELLTWNVWSHSIHKVRWNILKDHNILFKASLRTVTNHLFGSEHHRANKEAIWPIIYVLAHYENCPINAIYFSFLYSIPFERCCSSNSTFSHRVFLPTGNGKIKKLL